MGIQGQFYTVQNGTSLLGWTNVRQPANLARWNKRLVAQLHRRCCCKISHEPATWPALASNVQI